MRGSAALHAAALATVCAAPSAWPWAAGLAAANHAALAAAGMWPRSAWLGPNLRQLPQACAAGAGVGLTFDDGPDSSVTPAVLDLLDQAGMQASFFCIGRKAAAHPALAREITRRGHRVENHTLTHPNLFAALPLRALARQILDAQAMLADITGAAPRYFRAPMGLRSPLLEPVLEQAGLSLASWTRRGFDAVRRDEAGVLRRLTRGLAAGDILLLHDGNSAITEAGGKVVLAVLPGLIAHLSAQGLRGVSLPGQVDAAA
jgi:peptidoglycan/xylan/chitin deacetylase (PgdA/CDA1 family)